MNRLRPILRFAVSALPALVLLAACGTGRSPSESFYALNDGAPVVASTSNAAQGQPSPVQKSTLPGIVISAITIPELIDRPQIVTRDSANRVLVSEQNLWGESIRSGISRTLATRLSRALADAGLPVQVASYPQTSIASPVLRITVDIVRFDAEPNGEAVVDAIWSIRRPADDLVRTGHTVASSPIAGTSYEAIVGAWNKAVADVDRDIAAMILELGVDSPPSGAR